MVLVSVLSSGHETETKTKRSEIKTETETTIFRSRDQGLGLETTALISSQAAEMIRLSIPRTTLCKFPAHMSYVVAQVSIRGFEPGTVQLLIRRATTGPPRHTQYTITARAINSSRCIYHSDKQNVEI